MSETREASGYFPDIDGLRALAVVAVLLFHLEVPGFAGGYVGVDIFFVISGFLISSIIRRRVQSRDFRFSEFYARRISRLLPAVLATVTATAVAAVFVLAPEQIAGFARSATASILSAANFVFYFESGYWDTSSDLKPLLHLWSLGVEEQFYLLWPVTIVIIHKLSERAYKPALLLIFIFSLTACIAVTRSDEAAAFYLLPFRIWQFILGALAAEAWLALQFTKSTCTFLRTTGLILCCVSVVAFSDATPFPGGWALLPSFGAALVLMAATEKSDSFLLSNPISIHIGRLSYSLYLVHWPPIALYHSATLLPMTTSTKVALGGLAIALTIALHYGIEKRFYKRGRHQVRWNKPATHVVSAALVLAIILLPAQLEPERFTTQEIILSPNQIEQYTSNRYRLVSKVCRINELGRDENCPKPEEPAILFIGNSHEPGAYNILAAAVGLKNLRPSVLFGTINGCRDFTSTHDWASASNADCQERLDALRRSLDNTEWHTVVYGARKPYARNKTPLVQILETIRANSPRTKIVLVNDYLSTNISCPKLINRFGSTDFCRDPRYIELLPGFVDYEMPMRPRLEAITDIVFDKTTLLCGDKLPASCPTQTPDGHPFSIDRHHLTLEFAQWAGSQLSERNPLWLEAIKIEKRDPVD
tara:strand:+ start:955 stop:2898 length:1944 start_codon:yes stop_codon:yes gene_type:complete